MLKKLAGWFKSIFAKTVATEIRQTVVATASETVNKFVNDADNQACTEAPRRDPGRRPPRSGAQAGARLPSDFAALRLICGASCGARRPAVALVVRGKSAAIERGSFRVG